MAPPKKKPAAAAAAPAFDMTAFKTVIDATRNPAVGFAYYDKAALGPLVAAGYVEVREDIVDERGAIAARTTAAGDAAYDALVAAAAAPATPFAAPPAAPFAPVMPAAVVPAAAAAPVAAAVAPVAAAAAPAAAVADSGVKVFNGVPMPAARAFGKTAVYPFESLATGQCFVVAATADKPNPAKSLASTVNSANGRYATVDAAGKVNGHTKHFILRNIPDGAQFGAEFAGKKVAAVWRDK